MADSTANISAREIQRLS